MNDHENYNASNENRKDIRKLVCEFYAVIGNAPPSEEEIERTIVTWERIGAVNDGVSALEFGKSQIAEIELEKRIDAESTTVEERRRRIENELEIPTEEQGTLDIAMDDIEWLEAKTGCRIEEIHSLNDELWRLINTYADNLDDEKVKDVLERSEETLESAISAAKEHLQSVLALQQKQSVKPSANVPVRHVQQCARTASRARRSATRPTGGGGSPCDDDDGDPDSSDSDPPAPIALAHYPHSLTSHFKRNKLIPRRCWRVAEGRRAA